MPFDAPTARDLFPTPPEGEVDATVRDLFDFSAEVTPTPYEREIWLWRTRQVQRDLRHDAMPGFVVTGDTARLVDQYSMVRPNSRRNIDHLYAPKVDPVVVGFLLGAVDYMDHSGFGSYALGLRSAIRGTKRNMSHETVVFGQPADVAERTLERVISGMIDGPTLKKGVTVLVGDRGLRLQTVADGQMAVTVTN